MEVYRLNIRNCGGTEDMTPTSYHGGLTEDLKAVVRTLIEENGERTLFLGGFSLGGNIVLKTLGEMGKEVPGQVKGAAVISPSIQFAASADGLNQGRINRFYQAAFIRGLKQSLRRKNALYPEQFPLEGLEGPHTLRSFDDRFTAPLGGFRNADDYYLRSSSRTWIPHIEVETLMITSRDDSLVPFDSVECPEINANPHVALLATGKGGHVGFIAREPARSRCWKDLDCFWAENRIVEFCNRIAEA